METRCEICVKEIGGSGSESESWVTKVVTMVVTNGYYTVVTRVVTMVVVMVETRCEICVKETGGSGSEDES